MGSTRAEAYGSSGGSSAGSTTLLSGAGDFEKSSDGNSMGSTQKIILGVGICVALMLLLVLKCYCMRRRWSQQIIAGSGEEPQYVAASPEERRKALADLFKNTNCQTELKGKDFRPRSVFLHRSTIRREMGEMSMGSSELVGSMILVLCKEDRKRLPKPSQKCAVCMDFYVAGDTIAWSQNCDHVFHQDCLERYFAGTKTEELPCPCCRTDFMVPQKGLQLPDKQEEPDDGHETPLEMVKEADEENQEAN